MVDFNKKLSRNAKSEKPDFVSIKGGLRILGDFHEFSMVFSTPGPCFFESVGRIHYQAWHFEAFHWKTKFLKILCFLHIAFAKVLNFVSRGSKSGTRGRLPRDVKQNALDNPIWLEPCNMQQFLVTQPLLLWAFESQRSAPSLKFASRASIFDACQNHCALDKNLEI